MARTASLTRNTTETQIELSVNLDGTGQSQVETGIGFFDHMLTLLAKHGALDLAIRAKGDLHVDQHHTVEDVAICLGQAINDALGEKAGIRRYGHFTLPMDETLVTTAIDLGGRAYCEVRAEIPSPKIGGFDTELLTDFFEAFASSGRCNLHLLVHYGRNAHHIAETGPADAVR